MNGRREKDSFYLMSDICQTRFLWKSVKLFHIPSWWCWPRNRRRTFQEAEHQNIKRNITLKNISPEETRFQYQHLQQLQHCPESWWWTCPGILRCGSSCRPRPGTEWGHPCRSCWWRRGSRSQEHWLQQRMWHCSSPGTPELRSSSANNDDQWINMRHIHHQQLLQHILTFKYLNQRPRD